MSERPREGYRLTRATLAFGATVAALAIACGSDKEAPPPEGFSRNTNDYAWHIRIDIEKNANGESFARLYTNIKPILKSNGGVSHITAKDVYCPRKSDFRKKAGCTAEFMRDFELVSPKRISVTDNLGIR